MISKFTIFIILSQSLSLKYYEPEQVHISLGYLDDEMIVTWASATPSQVSYVEYEEFKENKENLRVAYQRVQYPGDVNDDMLECKF